MFRSFISKLDRQWMGFVFAAILYVIMQAYAESLVFPMDGAEYLANAPRWPLLLDALVFVAAVYGVFKAYASSYDTNLPTKLGLTLLVLTGGMMALTWSARAFATDQGAPVWALVEVAEADRYDCRSCTRNRNFAKLKFQFEDGRTVFLNARSDRNLKACTKLQWKDGIGGYQWFHSVELIDPSMSESLARMKPTELKRKCLAGGLAHSTTAERGS